MSNGTPPDADSLQKTWDKWSKLVNSVAPPVIAVLGLIASLVFGSLADKYQTAVNVVGIVLTTVLVGVVWLVLRLRRSAPPPVPPAPLGKLAAFRLLSSFHEGDDDVPGKARGQDALGFATQIQNPSFTFGVISGGSGVGKTSLLACAVQRRLAVKGINPVFVPNPRSLGPRPGSPVPAAPAPPGPTDPTPPAAPPAPGPDLTDIRRDLQALRDRVDEHLKKEGDSREVVVLLVDQFEEFLIDYPLPEQRRALAEGLEGLVQGSPPVKVVVAVREEFFDDLHGILRRFPAAALTRLRNFTVPEAVDVIEDCARRDGVPLGPGFAHKVANDLSEGNSVPPSGLQIVCTKLRGDLTLDRYKKEYGALGILSDHVVNSLLGCPDQVLAGRILRDLCDFPSHGRQGPRSAAEIRDKLLEPPPVPATHLDAVLAPTLSHLEMERLVRCERRGPERAYSLAQDYLVDAVAYATSGKSKIAEQAEQVVNYYLAESRNRPSRWRPFAEPLIPWTKLQLVLRHADAALRQKPDVRRLLQESVWGHRLRAAGFVALFFLAAFVLSNAVTFETSWQLEAADHHWPSGRHGPVLFFEPLAVKGKPQVGTSSALFPPQAAGPSFLPGPNDTAPAPGTRPGADALINLAKSYVRVWQAEDAKRVACFSGRLAPLPAAESCNYVLYARSEPDRSVRVLCRAVSNLGKTVECRLPPEAALGLSGPVNVADQYVAYITPSTGGEAGTVHVFDLDKNQEIGSSRTAAGEAVASVLPPHGAGPVRILLRTLAAAPPSEAAVADQWKLALAIWTVGGEKKTLGEGDDPSLFSFAADPPTGRVALLAPPGPGAKPSVRLWSGDSPDPVATRTLDDPEPFRNASLLFAPGGGYLEAFGRSVTLVDFPMAVWKTSDLSSSTMIPEAPGEQARAIYGRGGTWLAWPGKGKTTFWDVGANPPTEVSGLELGAGQTVVLSDKGDKALVVAKGDEIALWDLGGRQRVASIDVSGSVYAADFTLDGGAFFVRTEGGALLLYSAKDGRKVAELVGVGGDSQTVYCDVKSGRINVWTSEGRVLRYRWTWGTWLTRWFARSPGGRASEPCGDDEPAEPWEDQIPFTNPVGTTYQADASTAP